MTGPVDPRDLRVSDDERSHVLNILERATGRGMIDLGEYSERSAAVLAAKTRGELNRVLVDLPGLQIAGRPMSAATPVNGPTPGFSGAPRHWDEPIWDGPAPDVLELTGWGSRSFRGHWVVPPKIVIGGFGGSTRLDFTQAQLSSRRVIIEFRNNFGGSCEIVVPKGAAVHTERLAMRGGSLQNRVPPGPAQVLDLELTGSRRGGSLMIRHPKAKLFGGWS